MLSGIDLKRQRLLVTEPGNDSLGVVDLSAGKLLRTITGFSEPLGVAYVSSADSVFVANGADGSVRVLRGEDLAPAGRIDLGEDADNVRVDAQRNRVLVGFGKGALAVIDPTTRTRVTDIRLKGHPEGFQIDETKPGSLPMFRRLVRSRSWISRLRRLVRGRRKGRKRISRWWLIAKRAGFWSSFGAPRH